MNNVYNCRCLTASKAWTDKKCQWCGKYFEDGDSISLIIPSIEDKKKYKKLSRNYVLHTIEFEQLKMQATSDEDLIHKIANKPTPRISQPLSENQEATINAFRAACKELGFNIETQRGDELKFRRNGTSAQVILNTRTGRISTTQRAKQSIMDKLYAAEFEAKVHNKMVLLLGTGQIDNFSANAVIQEAIEKTNSLMKK